MGYSPWDSKRVGHDFKTEHMHKVEGSPTGQPYQHGSWESLWSYRANLTYMLT